MKLRREIADLFISFALPPIIWSLFLAWYPGLLIENHDGIIDFYLQARDLFAQHGDWTRTLYNLGIQGGAKLHETLGTLPLLEFFAHIGLNPATALNLQLFSIQGAFAYLVLKSATELTELFGRQATDRLPARVCVAMLAAFTPLIAWFLPYGHESYMLGALVFVVIGSLGLSVAMQRLTAPQAFISLLVLIQAIRGSGQQAIFYGVVFGAPILLGGTYDIVRKRMRIQLSQLIAAICIGLSALLIALPGYWGMLAHAFGSDAARSASSHITYSYYTSQWRDWLQLFTWTIRAIPSDLPEVLYHEVNYAVGPLILLALAFQWERARGLACGLIISIAMALFLSTNTQPLSSLLLALIPPLEMFRVPARAIFPGVLTVITIASSVLLTASPSTSQANASSKKKWIVRVCALMLSAASLIFLKIDPLHGLLREALAWCLAGFIFIDVRRVRNAVSHALDPIWRDGAVLLLMGLSLHPFYERLLPRIPIAAVEQNLKLNREALLKQAPELSSPLTRIVLDYMLAPWGPNTSWAIGVSSIDGYIQTNRRFHDLVDATRGEVDTTGTMMNYHFGDTPVFHLLAPLYNVKYRALAQRNGPRVEPTGMGNGPAWFAHTISTTESFAHLVQNLKAWDGKKAWYIPQDPAISPSLKDRIQNASSKECTQSRVMGIQTKLPTDGLSIEVDTPTSCVLTVAMNFVSSLEVESAGRLLEIFPIYGALTGILVPAGHQFIQIKDAPRMPNWTLWAQALGILTAMISLSGLTVLRLSKTRASP